MNKTVLKHLVCSYLQNLFHMEANDFLSQGTHLNNYVYEEEYQKSLGNLMMVQSGLNQRVYSIEQSLSLFLISFLLA